MASSDPYAGTGRPRSTSSGPGRVLVVDDEPLVLAGVRRLLSEDYIVVTAESGPKALELLATRGPFDVVISDMRMPQMDGATLLSEVRLRAPDTTRILLTGQSDMDAAMDAVNRGRIFRFLSKPCPLDQLRAAVEAAVEQHRLVTAEARMLAETVNGAIRVLCEVLSLASPLAFSRASAVRRHALAIATELGWEATWHVEMAAMLSRLGCIALPADLLDRWFLGGALSSSESELFARHPEVGRRLLASIPRLEQVADMVAAQTLRGPIVDDEPIVHTGGRIVRAAAMFDEVAATAQDTGEAVERLLEREPDLDPRIVAALASRAKPSGPRKRAAVVTAAVENLRVGMALAQDAVTPKGHVIVRCGTEVTPPLLERLRSFACGVGVVEPLHVHVPDLYLEGAPPSPPQEHWRSL